MNCNHVRDQLSAYLDNEIPLREMQQIREHLKSCNSCREELEALTRLVEATKSLDQVELPSDFHLNLHERLVHEENSPRQPRFIPGRILRQINWKVATSVAACLLIVFLSKGFLGNFLTKSAMDMNMTSDLQRLQSSTEPPSTDEMTEGLPEIYNNSYKADSQNNGTGSEAPESQLMMRTFDVAGSSMFSVAQGVGTTDNADVKATGSGSGALMAAAPGSAGGAAHNNASANMQNSGINASGEGTDSYPGTVASRAVDCKESSSFPAAFFRPSRGALMKRSRVMEVRSEDGNIYEQVMEVIRQYATEAPDVSGKAQEGALSGESVTFSIPVELENSFLCTIRELEGIRVSILETHEINEENRYNMLENQSNALNSKIKELDSQLKSADTDRQQEIVESQTDYREELDQVTAEINQIKRNADLIQYKVIMVKDK